MKNYIKIIIAVVLIFIIGAFFYYQKPKNPIVTKEQTPLISENSIIGCYVAYLAKDVYSLKILSQSGEQVEGELEFNNFEKDSSNGTFKGTYKNGIILADYTFQSEGTLSVAQVIFKKTTDGFVRGYGDVDLATGTHFVDLNNITYDSSVIFKFSKEDCTVINVQPEVTSSIPKGKLKAGSTPAGDPKIVESNTWIWQKTIMNDGTVVTPKKVGIFTLSFDSTKGSVSGRTDCNSFSGSYKMGSDGFIIFGPMASTLMFCEGSQESLFTGAINNSSKYMIDSSGNLVLLLFYDSGSVIFKKQ